MVDGLNAKDAELAAISANLAQQQSWLTKAVKEMMRQEEQQAVGALVLLFSKKRQEEAEKSHHRNIHHWNKCRVTSTSSTHPPIELSMRNKLCSCSSGLSYGVGC